MIGTSALGTSHRIESLLHSESICSRPPFTIISYTNGKKYLFTFLFVRLKFGCVFEFRSSLIKAITLLIETTLVCVKHPCVMGKAGTLSLSSNSSKEGSKRTKLRIETGATGQREAEDEGMQVDELIASNRVTSDASENWKTVSRKRSNPFQKSNAQAATTNEALFAPVAQSSLTSGVHSYFSFGSADLRAKPKRPIFNSAKTAPTQQQQSSSALPFTNERKRQKSTLPPVKVAFERQQKPAEIHVLNDLVKHDNRLHVSSASYSTLPHSRHVLLVYANDSATYEMLLESNSWPPTLGGLQFKVTLPTRTPTSYSVIVNRVPKDWQVDTIKPLIAQRYLSTVQVTRIFREGQPINRIRVDFRSNEDVQTIVSNSHIFIDSIRYPAVAYKPLVRLDRCFRCQQFGHRAANCTNESKCFKCGDQHEYNRDCANAVKCANCSGTHMAGSPECPVKIGYRREQRQQQEEKRATPSQQFVHSLPSPARLYSSVLQTAAPQVHAAANKRTGAKDRPTDELAQPSIIISTLKAEIERSQEVLLNCMMQLTAKCDAVRADQTALRCTLDTQIMPHVSTMTELFVDVCEQLMTGQIIKLSLQQQTHLLHLRQEPKAASAPLSPLGLSSDSSSSQRHSHRQQPSPSTSQSSQ